MGHEQVGPAATESLQVGHDGGQHAGAFRDAERFLEEEVIESEDGDGRGWFAGAEEARQHAFSDGGELVDGEGAGDKDAVEDVLPQAATTGFAAEDVGGEAVGAIDHVEALFAGDEHGGEASEDHGGGATGGLHDEGQRGPRGGGE